MVFKRFLLIGGITLVLGSQSTNFLYSKWVQANSWTPNTTQTGIRTWVGCSMACLMSDSNCPICSLDVEKGTCKFGGNVENIILTSSHPLSNSIPAFLDCALPKQRIGVLGKKDGQEDNAAFDYHLDGNPSNRKSFILPYPEPKSLNPHILKYEDGILYCGGIQSWNIQSSQCRFARFGNWTWEPFEDLPQKFGQGDSIVLGGVPILVGGYHNAFVHNKLSWYRNGNWQSGPDLPHKTMGHVFVSLTPSLALLFGLSVPSPIEHVHLRNSYTFNLVTQTWNNAGNISNGRKYIKAGVLTLASTRTVVVAVGGLTGDQYWDVVDIFDVSTRTWSVASHSFPSEICCGFVIVVDRGTRLLYMGGKSGYETTSDRVFEYVHNQNWRQLANLDQPLHSFSGFVYNHMNEAIETNSEPPPS